MKNIRIQICAGALFFFVGFSQILHAGDTKKKYVYKGEESAKSICMSIAKNNVNRLNRALKYRKSRPLDRKVHERYSCNGKDLLSFAEEMQASNAIDYLAKKFEANPSNQTVATTEKP